MSHEWDFVIKKDDTGPDLEVQFLDEDGDPVNITGCLGVTFRMMDEKTNATKVEDDATIVDGAIGYVKYEWAVGDTDTAGTYLGEFHTTLGTGQKVTFPNNDYIKIRVYERVASLSP